MSPEQAAGKISDLGPLTDVYSLGAILFEIITGQPPHDGKDAVECLTAAAQNKIVSTKQTGELIDITYRAMSTKLADRWQSIAELSNAVREYLTHRESIALAILAEDDLERAQESDQYSPYAKARFGFEEALKLWKGNKQARIGLGAVRLAYARCAFTKGDYDLASSLLDPKDRTHEKLKADIDKANDERDARYKRLIAAKRWGRADRRIVRGGQRGRVLDQQRTQHCRGSRKGSGE